MKVFSIVFLSFLVFSVADASFTEGMKIAVKIRKANKGIISEKSNMEMLLIDAHGREIVRKMKTLVMETRGDGEKTLMSFIAPKDIRGTKMLTWAHLNRDDDQWLYLGFLKRAKKISSNNKGSSFMGSEFSFEDLGSQEPQKYKYKLINSKKVKGKKVWVMERYPLGKSSYSKLIIYNSKKLMNPLKIKYFDKKGSLLKIAKISGYRKYKRKNKTFYRASKIVMENVQTKKKSIMKWIDRQLGEKLSPLKFTKAALGR